MSSPAPKKQKTGDESESFLYHSSDEESNYCWENAHVSKLTVAQLKAEIRGQYNMRCSGQDKAKLQKLLEDIIDYQGEPDDYNEDDWDPNSGPDSDALIDRTKYSTPRLTVSVSTGKCVCVCICVCVFVLCCACSR